MCSTHYTITPKDIYRYAAGMLQPHLRWQDHGLCCVTFLPAQHGHPVPVFRKLMHRTVLQRTDLARRQRPSDLS